MKLGDIKAEALKIIGINQQMDITYLDVLNLKLDPTYATYLFSMVGAINRALDRFYVKEAIDEPVNITAETMEDTEMTDLGINDVLARMIPLYVVGDAFATEEPSFAAEKRNEFEGALEEYLHAQRFQQERVEIVHEVW
jgi:hypothetical protein